MNIVIYSYNFLPQADAESYCATRFASALARAGHSVIVVTMDWPMQVSEKTYSALVSDKLKIIRVPFSTHKNTPVKALLWYGHKSQMAVDVPLSIKITIKALKSVERPILVTRSFPVASTMVGLKTYKYAYKWIAHFSDPMPWNGYANTLGHKFLKRLEKNIIRKAFIKSDGISVTCKYVNKYFNDEYGDAFDEKKVFLTTHIGDYRLDTSKQNIEKKDTEPILLHPGTIYSDRGGLAIYKAMNELALENYKCKFIQVGNINGSLQNILVDSDNIKIHNTTSIEKSLETVKSTRAIFVPDFESELNYSPFFLSKFVYQIMGDIPFVLYTKKNSEMYDYAIQYPESGIFWAEAGNIDSLKNAIKSAMECDSSLIDRSRIRKCFTEETVVDSFIKSIDRI